jgi:acetyl esterase/lipase
MKRYLMLCNLSVGLLACLAVYAQENPSYKSELNIPYCTVDGKELKLNAFLPQKATNPAPAIVHIHGGWWYFGEPARKFDDVGGGGLFARKGLAIFAIQYRLGPEGGFPQSIRDCRNAIRFIRRNAKRFNIDPERIDVCGDSAGGELAVMVAMVPEEFQDGGPAPGLEGVSARVSGSFSWIQVTDFVRFWNQEPDDAVTNADGKITFRGPGDKDPYNARPRLRVLFHGIAPDTAEGKALYTRMSPIGHVRKDVPPMLICDGEKDSIVPGLHGKVLHEALKAAGADSTYWMTVGGDHGFPRGDGFESTLDGFIGRTLKLNSP